MDVYTLLGKDDTEAPEEIGFAVYRLLKCYDFAASNADEQKEKEILSEKLDQVEEVAKTVDIYVPNPYAKEQEGLYQDYFEVLDMMERDSSARGMQQIINRLERCMQDHPGSVLFSTLSAAIMEQLKDK